MSAKTFALHGLALASLFAAQGAQALDLDPARLATLAPAQRALLLRQVAPSAALGKLDTTVPVLKSVKAATAVDAGKNPNQLLVNLQVSDELSGMMMVFVTATNPSHTQQVGGGVHLGSWPAFKGAVALRFGPYAEPGVWTVSEVWGFDVAYNTFSCTADCLAALGGNLQFTVSGTKADAQAPTLVSGKVATPVVSRSTPAKGTAATNPFVRVQVSTADTGGSGTAGAMATFCLADDSQCFSTWSENWVYAQKSSTLYGYTSLWPEIATGTYWLKSLQLNDHGGAGQTYTSTVFGGSTDFSVFFPTGTSVTIEP